MPVDRLEIGVGRRDLNIVERRDVEGPIAAYAEIDAGCADQRLDLRLYQAGRRGRRGNRDVIRQAVALHSVEYGEPLQERDRLCVLAGLPGAALLVLRHETVGIGDGRAALALADMAAERQRLAEGDPALAGKAVLDHGAPEDQDIDAGIPPASRGVARHRQGCLGGGRTPGLDPGKPARLQLGDDLGGDVVVEARPVRSGARAASMSGHCGSPRRAPEASLPALNPSRQSRSALSL